MRQRIALLLVSLLASIGVAVGLNASPALAAHTGPAGYTTIWDGCPVGYCGAAWPLPVGSTHICRSLPTGANDKPSAVDNYTSWKFTFYKDAGCSGTAYVIYAGTYTGALAPSQGNNNWSSYYVG